MSRTGRFRRCFFCLSFMFIRIEIDIRHTHTQTSSCCTFVYGWWNVCIDVACVVLARFLRQDSISCFVVMKRLLFVHLCIDLISYSYLYVCRYAGQTKEDYLEVLRLCCIIKTMVSWNYEQVSTIGRERCGGQGYAYICIYIYVSWHMDNHATESHFWSKTWLLNFVQSNLTILRLRFLSANRFGESIAGAHAGITAEGDNRVLMQKVTKELLTGIQVYTFHGNKIESILILHVFVIDLVLIECSTCMVHIYIYIYVRFKCPIYLYKYIHRHMAFARII